jgi:CHASE2 domain-containing sensor protein
LIDLTNFLEHAKTVGRLVWRPIVRKGWMHWLRFAALLAAGSYLGHVLSESPRFADIRYELYQRQVRLQHRGPIYPQHTVLVLLNDDDYWSTEFQARAPLKLEQLAVLLDKLNAAGANTVGVDVFLSSPLPRHPDYDFPDYVPGDDAFFAAVKRMCDAGRHVVLTSYVVEVKKDIYHEEASIYTGRLPGLPCVSAGQDAFNDDMRKIPGLVELETGKMMDSFSLAMVKIADPVAYDNLVKDEDKGFRFAQYLTRQDFDPRSGRTFILNGVAVRQMDSVKLRQAVADKIVIVGGNWSSYGYGLGAAVDEHNSPGGLQPGAMLHANYVEAELNQSSTFTPISDRTAEILEWSLALLLALISASELPGGWKGATVTLSFVLSAILTYVLMQNLGLFLDFLIPFLIVVGHTFTEELLEMRNELQHARHKLKEHAK